MKKDGNNDYGNTEDQIRAFWNMEHPSTAIYASDLDASLFPEQLNKWNLNKLSGTDSVIHKIDQGMWMRGVQTPFLYIGLQNSAFPCHVEDDNLNSVSYLHFGAPKV